MAVCVEFSLPLIISVTIDGRTHPSSALIGIFGKSSHHDPKTPVLNSEKISYKKTG